MRWMRGVARPVWAPAWQRFLANRLDLQDEERTEEGDHDTNGEDGRIAVGRRNDERGEQWGDGLAEGGREVEEAEVFARLFLVGQHINVKSLVDGAINAVAEACDQRIEIHARGGREDPRHRDADAKQHTGKHNGHLAATEPIGNGAGTERRHERDDEGNDGHCGDSPSRGGLILAEVVLHDV